MRRVQRHAPMRGFTLIEALVVMTLIGIMLGLGIPSFRTFVNSQRVKSATTELMTSVLIARSEAIKLNAANVTIAPASAGDWTAGWTVAYGATTLHQQEALQSLSVTTYSDSSCGTAAPVPNVVFGNSGRAAASACFKVTADSTDTSRCVKVDLTGIPSSGSCP